MRVFKLLFLVAFPAALSAQKLPGDSLLANERSIDRPITVHRGQLRLTGDYRFSILSKEFDAAGELISLREAGSASISHRVALDVKYGLSEFIQLSASIARRQHRLSHRTEYIYPEDADPVISHQIINDHSGLEDLYVGVDLRAPLKTRSLDLALTVGAHLPTARFEARAPRHSFKSSGPDTDPVHHFTYRYYFPAGRGITVGRVGGMAKYRSRTWAISGRIDYEHGLVDGNGIDWIHQFDTESGFEYRRVPYTYRLPDSFAYFLEAEFQPRPWLDIFINGSGFTAFHGWISRMDNLKVAIPYRTVVLCSPGAEVLITPRLWVRGRVNIALAGKNAQAPIGFETMIMYNVFPF